MSDGDSATPGRRRPAEPGDDLRITATPPSYPAGAPSGRKTAAEAAAEPADEGPLAGECITVADLIAKVAADKAGPAGGYARHRADPEPEPARHRAEPGSAGEPPATPEAEPEPAAEQPAQVFGPYQPAVEPYPITGEVYPPAAEPYLPVAEPIPPAYIDPDNPATEVISAVSPVSVYTPELPDLAALDHVQHPTTSAHYEDPAPFADEPLDPSDPGNTDTPTPRHRRAVVLGRVAAALLAVLALVLTGAAWQWQSSKNNSLNKVAALDPDSRDIVDPNAQFGDENFLIVGVDSRIGANSDMGAGDTADAAGARSDTVMLVNIPANRERVVAVSFPRDLAITPIQCQPWNAETGAYGPIWDDDTKSYGPDEVWTETKLNSAYAFGGPKCLVKVIQKLSGLSINRFMAVDFAGFAKMVDALGGVEVCSTTPLEDYELGTVLAHAGRQTVDGHTALNYVRARQVTTEVTGDYGRIKRQQLFLSSLLRSLISKDTFFSLSKLNNVVNMFIEDSYVDNIKTKDLVDLGQSIQGVNAGRITFVTVPTGITDANGNEPPRQEDMQALFSAIINDDPLPGEKNPDNTPIPGTPESATQTVLAAGAAPAPDTADVVDALTVAPQDVTVRVSNSTGVDGLAASAAAELQAHGFNVASPDDYPEALSATTVFFSPGHEQAAVTVASAFANPTLERVAGQDESVRVVLGTDFHSVGTPAASGTPVQVHVAQGSTPEPVHLPEDLTVTNAADTTCE